MKKYTYKEYLEAFLPNKKKQKIETPSEVGKRLIKETLEKLKQKLK